MRIAIYGLSTETEKVIPNLEKEYEIVGLLDGFRNDGEIYGYPIISFDKAILKGIEKIIVVARPGSCKAIAKKIGDSCREKGVLLFDIRGKDLLSKNKVVYDFSNVPEYTCEMLLEQIKSVEAVSFDLFDTLVVRNILSSTDVLELVENSMNEQGIEVDDFLNKRLSAEKRLSQGRAPRLVEIYKEILGGSTSDGMARRLANLEYETERSLLLPRDEMVAILKSAKKDGKRIYITSESYYSREQIETILEENGISPVDDVLVSCEYDTGKTGDLYEGLKEVAQTSNILHIGDDLVADIESATRHGLKAFHIYSASELLDMVGGLGTNSLISNISDKIRIGMFVAIIFNSPFQFEDNKEIHIDSAEDIGYLCLAPMLLDFSIWFNSMVKDDRYSDVWFSARDGYIVKKICEIINEEMKSQYFLTSRISAIRAGMETREDIEYVDSMKFSGTIADNLKNRFGIVNSDIVGNCAAGESLTAFSEEILELAKIKRKNNLKYIDSLGLGKKDVAFFDFVAKGTTQMYAQKLINNHICGLYFLQLEPDYMKDKGLEIIPFYSEDEREKSAIFDNYYILETILTSPLPSVNEFDELGNPIYAEETRLKEDIGCVMKVQDGILDYVNKYLNICPNSERRVNKQLDEAMLQLIHKVQINANDFIELTVEDPFFNRMTDIKDVL